MKSLNILLGFLPWILFSALFGPTEKEIIISIVVACAVFVKTEWSNLRKGFVLSWGTITYFVFIFLFAVLLNNQWVIKHVWLLSNLALALIAWVSLFIGQPFTMQYAREQTPPYIWKKPGFIRINQILTIAWGSVFLFSTALYVVPFGHTALDKIIYQILMYASIVFGIWFTKVFPTWYRERQQKLRNKNNPYLQGNYAPIRVESDFNNLTVIGKMPADLHGVYMRNGPNPAFEPISYTYPLDGDGMIHAIYCKDQSANYRNRYVKTKGLLLEQREGRAIYGGVAMPIPPDPKLIGPNDDPGPFKNGAFIHIIRHAKHYLAMWEGGPAYEVDVKLNTISEWHPGTTKPLSVGPHTRFDPVSGELYCINYDIEQPFLVCHRIDKTGQLTATETIDKPYSTMMHDFAMTQNYFIFFDCPAVLDTRAAEIGGNVLQWHPELGTRIGIIPRDKTEAVIWLNTEAFFVFHFANAYEQDNTVIVDYVRHNHLGFGADQAEAKLPPKLYRMIINLTDKTLQEIQLSDYPIEFPTFNRDYNTRQYQFVYGPIRLNQAKGEFNALLKYDLASNSATIHDFGQDYEIGEAYFAPRPSAKAEDDGYLMLFAYCKTANTSEFIILDAQQMADTPVARVLIPQRVPHGLHGSWLPG